MRRIRLSRIANGALVVVVALLLLALVRGGPAAHPPALVLVGELAAVTQAVALWWRRVHPVPVMAVTLAGGLVVHLLAPYALFPVAALVALGSLVTTRPPRVSLPALAALLGLSALNFNVAPVDDAQFVMLFPVVIWSLGEAVRNRRAAVAEASRRAAGEERARIAHELHDVIAHSVSVIVVQAAAADDVFDERPDQARAALRSIEVAGRDALGELRRLLSTVRPEGGPADPQPGLDRLEELVERLREAGLRVVVRREGVTGTLPAGIDLSAYRIVQEALTNTLRHAEAGRAQVTVRASGGLLELEITDEGRGAVGGGTGRGITGMRERAALLGGTLEAGTPPGGGFRVHARLPLPGGVPDSR
ncbi:sensor histidine kinase [Streptosporangium sp. NPDC002721]|uniref:sensor histidine kinase n=1 Tax=Streptosporangium sp. NPDC002721 TaxID=3366188 RepID=UPI0036B87312